MSQRLDKWLVYARLVKHRSDAQALIARGGVRLNRQRVVKSSQTAKPGDILTLSLHAGVKVLRISAEALRRGSASEAVRLYEIIDNAPQKEDASDGLIC